MEIIKRNTNNIVCLKCNTSIENCKCDRKIEEIRDVSDIIDDVIIYGDCFCFIKNNKLYKIVDLDNLKIEEES